MSASVSIPGRFNGPLGSGQGGYSAARLAAFLQGRAEVTLRRRIPLDAPLDVRRQGDGSVRALDHGAVVMEARAAPEVDVEVPAPVGVREARMAMARYRGRPDGVFSRCFVCGRAREDALGLFAGAVQGRELVASVWSPPAWTADADGHVRPEFVWAVLDCPTYFALYRRGELPRSMLGRFAARVDAPVIAGEEHVVMAWPIGLDGRKHYAGSALLSADGRALASARALLIEPRQPSPPDDEEPA